MILIIFGPAGSGKGTQAEIIANNLGLRHFSTGDALREEIRKGTALGREIEPIINSGKLVSADIVNRLIMNSYKKSKSGMVLDGYPRTIEQLEFLKKNIKIDYAIELSVEDSEVIKRISTRRICIKCGKNYNIISLKPKVSGRCDACNSLLKQRDDDTPKEIRRRLAIYKKETFPLRKIYEKLGVLHVVDAVGSIDEVNNRLMNIIENG